MERIPAGEKMEIYQGNRVVVADPSQQGDQIGASHWPAAATKPADTDTVELTPTANLADLHEVTIMTPFNDATANAKIVRKTSSDLVFRADRTCGSRTI